MVLYYGFGYSNYAAGLRIGRRKKMEQFKDEHIKRLQKEIEMFKEGMKKINKIALRAGKSAQKFAEIVEVTEGYLVEDE